MQIVHYASGKRYVIGLPDGSRVMRSSGRPGPTGEPLPDVVVIPWGGRREYAFGDPETLLPMMAESGAAGLTIVSVTDVGPAAVGA